MTTSETNSVTTKRNLTVFDMLNGARIVGESVPGFDGFSVMNPTVLVLEKDGEDEKRVKISINPVLFASGALYQVQPHSVAAHYQCFDATVHSVYAQVLNGLKEKADGGTDDETSPADA